MNNEIRVVAFFKIRGYDWIVSC